MTRVDSANTGKTKIYRRSFPEQVTKEDYDEAMEIIFKLCCKNRNPSEDKKYNKAFEIKRKYLSLTNKYNE